MSIEQINGSNYSSKSSKSGSSSPVDAKKSGAESSKSGAVRPSDSLSLSGSKFESEIALTKKILDNTRQDSFAALKEIRKKIDAGAYENEAVQQKISALVDEDISLLHNINSKSTDDAEGEVAITAEHTEQLLQNPQITEKVAEAIAKNLQNI